MILAQMHRGQSTSTTHPLFVCLLTPGSCMIQPTKPNLLFFGLNFMGGGGGGSEKVWAIDILSFFFFMEDLPKHIIEVVFQIHLFSK